MVHCALLHCFRFVAEIIVRRAYRLRCTGLPNVPRTGPALVVCNHESFIDALVLSAAIRRPMRFVMANDYFERRALQPLFRFVRAIPVAPRHAAPDVTARAFDRVSEALRRGEVVCVFPEGCVTRDGGLNVFRRGVETILARDAVPVIPIALSGLWGSRFSRFERGAQRRAGRGARPVIDVRVGPPAPHGVDATGLQEIVAAMRARRRRTEGHANPNSPNPTFAGDRRARLR